MINSTEKKKKKKRKQEEEVEVPVAAPTTPGKIICLFKYIYNIYNFQLLAKTVLKQRNKSSSIQMMKKRQHQQHQ